MNSNVLFFIFRAAVEKLHCVDDAFRRQLESLQASHQAELLHLASDKQKQIEQANQKVLLSFIEAIVFLTQKKLLHLKSCMQIELFLYCSFDE